MNKKSYFFPADILLPKENPEKWAVVACDQYTSEPSYWQAVEETVGSAPSALRVILPELYLTDDNRERIAAVNMVMKQYREQGVFAEYPHTFVYTERTITGGAVRRGIVGLIDLEDYSYQKKSDSPIRATEQTVVERIPPRVQIRKDAVLELPHVMLLIDDPKRTVIEPLTEKKAGFSKLYDFDLMQNSGHITGYAPDAAASAKLQAAISSLAADEEHPMVFAVGDGNHSLAAARECYRLHPTARSRYALVEVVNLHDLSLQFEPIYRVVFGVRPDELIEGFVRACGGLYTGQDAQRFVCVSHAGEQTVSLRPGHKLSVGTLQIFLDRYLQENPSAKIDYIHGEDVVRRLSDRPDAVGFLFAGMQKDELFDAVRQDGSLPRKTFSMGHAADKRFYLEARDL